MNPSAIEWTDATWNPVSGCSKVSQGCKNCYAERIFARPYPGRAFTDVRTHMDRLEQPLRMRKPRRIFVNSMSDLFHEDVPKEFIADVFGVMAAARQHTFQVLTKRPARMRALLDDPGFLDAVDDCATLYTDADLQWPLPNVWLGVSVEDQATADERIPQLLQTPAAVRFISAGPLLGPISLDRWECDAGSVPGPHGIGGRMCPHCNGTAYGRCLHIDLVIAGYESGPGARPGHPEWAAQLRNQCKQAGTKFFFTQWGEWAPRSSLTMEFAVEAKAAVYVKLDGTAYDVHDESDRHQFDASDVMMYRAGKKFTGRTLDGREHSELPA